MIDKLPQSRQNAPSAIINSSLATFAHSRSAFPTPSARCLTTPNNSNAGALPNRVSGAIVAKAAHLDFMPAGGRFSDAKIVAMDQAAIAALIAIVQAIAGIPFTFDDLSVTAGF